MHLLRAPRLARIPSQFKQSSLLIRNQHYNYTKNFHTSIPVPIKALPPRPKINEDDIDESFLKGSGPGGQKINKTSSAVQLIHRPTGLVVKVQDTRSRSQNRKIARTRLAEAVELREKGDTSRLAIKAAVQSKRKASALKKSRRKYRALEAEKEGKEKDELEAGEHVKEDPAATDKPDNQSSH